MVEDFVDMCAFCKQGVPRTNMVYQKGLVFHSQCYTDHGGDFVAPDPDLAQLSARTRVELVQLKNMKVRSETQENPKPTKKKKASKKAKRKPKKVKRFKTKTKRQGSKTKQTKRKAKKSRKSRRRR